MHLATDFAYGQLMIENWRCPQVRQRIDRWRLTAALLAPSWYVGDNRSYDLLLQSLAFLHLKSFSFNKVSQKIIILRRAWRTRTRSIRQAGNRQPLPKLGVVEIHTGAKRWVDPSIFFALFLFWAEVRMRMQPKPVNISARLMILKKETEAR